MRKLVLSAVCLSLLLTAASAVAKPGSNNGHHYNNSTPCVVGSDYVLGSQGSGQIGCVQPGFGSNWAVQQTLPIGDPTAETYIWWTQIGGVPTATCNNNVCTPNWPIEKITHLSAEFRMLQGDCDGGSPRFEMLVAPGGEAVINNPLAGNIFFYIHGDSPGCNTTTDWQYTGDFTQYEGGLPGLWIDDHQLPDGTSNDTWSGVLAKYGAGGPNGDYTVRRVILGMDGQTNGQSAQFDNAQIANALYTFGG